MYRNLDTNKVQNRDWTKKKNGQRKEVLNLQKILIINFKLSWSYANILAIFDMSELKG